MATSNINPKAKVRNRPTPIFDATHPKVKDNKDHFPINTEGRARNALARVNQYSKAPSWWGGTLQQLVNAVVRAVKKKYKGIDISPAAKKPGAQKKKKASFPQDFNSKLNFLTKLKVDNPEIFKDASNEIKNKIASNQSFQGWSPNQLQKLIDELS